MRTPTQSHMFWPTWAAARRLASQPHAHATAMPLARQIVKNIGELNDLAGEGVGTTVTDAHGAQRIKMPDPIPLRIFKNGILMFEGPFRAYEEPETQTCIKDIQDGYFPGELQVRYPDGIPFELFDLRDTVYEGRETPMFPGTGMTLGGAAKPSRLVKSSNIRTLGDAKGAQGDLRLTALSRFGACSSREAFLAAKDALATPLNWVAAARVHRRRALPN